MRVPTPRLSNIQRVPMLPGCALTVTAMENGRDGDDDRVVQFALTKVPIKVQGP